MFFAMCLVAYAADLSTLLGSLPENAPPPCAPLPPYVSTMILRPVSPVSPCGPPITNFPVGLTWNMILESNNLRRLGFTNFFTLGMTILITSSLILASILASLSKSSCCVDTTIESIRIGLLSSEYSMVT